MTSRGILAGVFCACIIVAGAGCNRTSNAGPDNGNLAPVSDNATGQALPPQQAPPAEQTAPPEQAPPPEQYPETAAGAYPAATTCPPGEDCGEPVVEATEAPPALVQYQQPACPGPDYLWTPGYWGYASAGYYWVPGVWVMAPYVDALWTPPYWEFYGGRYRWHSGYWGRYVGFYGGINYGFGYTGLGFYGGYWNQGAFVYNSAVANVSVRVVHDVYSRRVTNFTPFNRISYNGGPGGIDRRATPAELAVRSQTRIAPLPAQTEQWRSAAANRAQFARENSGRPALTAQAHPLATSYRTPAPAPRGWQQAGRENGRAPNAGTVPREAQPPAAARTEPGNARGGEPAGRAMPEASRRELIPQRSPEAEGQARPGQPAMRPEPQGREAARPTAPEQRPEAAREARPAPSPMRAEPQGREAARPAAPEQRPEAAREARPAPTRAAPQQGHPAARPATPERRPEGGRQNQSAAPAMRPAPQVHAAPQRPQEASRQARPAGPAMRPAPPAHAAARPAAPAHPQQARPAPKPSSPQGGEPRHHG
jgi:hypothetical protein